MNMAQFNRDWRMNTTIYCCYFRSVSFRCACQRASNAKQIAKHVVASMGISSRKQFKQDFAPAKKTRNQIERNETKRNRRLKTEKRNGILGRVVAWSRSCRRAGDTFWNDARNAPKSPIDCAADQDGRALSASDCVSSLCSRLFVLNGLSVRSFRSPLT